MDKRGHLADHLPTPFCSRGYWMPPKYELCHFEIEFSLQLFMISRHGYLSLFLGIWQAWLEGGRIILLKIAFTVIQIDNDYCSLKLRHEAIYIWRVKKDATPLTRVGEVMLFLHLTVYSQNLKYFSIRLFCKGWQKILAMKVRGS